MTSKHSVLITGAAGYVGGMLVRKFAGRDDVERVIGLDMAPMPDFISDIEKLTYLEINTAEHWQKDVEALAPDVIVHAAWYIRELYGNRAQTWAWNIDGSDNVFDYAFEHSEVKRLVHFSSVASYGSFASNRSDHFYTEDEPLRQSPYLYAEEKRIAEQHLRSKYELNGHERPDLSIAVVRPASITGPRGRFMRLHFGLQSALAGKLTRSFLERVVSLLTALMPTTPRWLRQFIHEDDVVGIIERIAFGEAVGAYEVYNLCPPGPVVTGLDMARAMGKRRLFVSPWMVGFAFFIFWHLTRGRVPTAPGAWRGYSFPIAVDGTKVIRELGYQYRHAGYDALRYTDGEYEYAVPAPLRRNAP